MTSMDESWNNWLCDTEPNNYSFVNPYRETQNQCSYATLSYTENTTFSMDESSLENPSKLFKSCTTSNSANNTEHLLQNTICRSSNTLSFENSNPPPPPQNPETKFVNTKNTEPRSVAQESKKKNDSISGSTHHIPDHIIAERMRREKISKQFIALAALIPNLKKMDKASVLGDAIKYVKELKEEVKVKEEGRKRKRKSVESLLNSCNGNCDEPAQTNVLPEVKATVSGKKVLIRILCEKDKAVLSNIFREIDKYHLLVISCSSLTFGSSLLAITIISMIEDDELKESVQIDIVAQNLKVGLMQLMEGQ